MPSVRLNPSAVCAACVLALLCLLAQARAAEPQPHWAFQPVREPRVPELPGKVISKKVISGQSEKPSPPASPTQSLITNYSSPIDAFVLAKLAPKGWTLSAPADKRTLIRREIGRAHV